MSNRLFERNDFGSVRGIEKQCQVCQKIFGVFIREHQCKRCFKAVCSDCGNYRKDVFLFDMLKKNCRICKNCKISSEFICEYVKNNNLKFGEMSEVGKKWMKKISKRPLNNSLDDTKSMLFKRDTFKKVWDSYSFQLRQLIGILTYDLNQQQIYQSVNNVYSTVIAAAPDEDIESLIYLIVFLLCFCTVDKAVIVCLYLIDLKSIIKQEKQLIQAYLKAVNLKEEYVKKLSEYVEYRVKRCSSSFFINALTVEGAIYMFERIFEKRQIQELYMFASLHLESNREFIVKHKNNKPLCDLTMLRNCKVQSISLKYKYLKSVKSVLYMSEVKPDQILDILVSTHGIRRRNNSFQENIEEDFINVTILSQENQHKTMYKPFKKKASENNTIMDSFYMKNTLPVLGLSPEEDKNQLYLSGLCFSPKQNSPTESTDHLHFLNSPKISDHQSDTPLKCSKCDELRQINQKLMSDNLKYIQEIEELKKQMQSQTQTQVNASNLHQQNENQQLEINQLKDAIELLKIEKLSALHELSESQRSQAKAREQLKEYANKIHALNSQHIQNQMKLNRCQFQILQIKQQLNNSKNEEKIMMEELQNQKQQNQELRKHVASKQKLLSNQQATINNLLNQLQSSNRQNAELTSKNQENLKIKKQNQKEILQLSSQISSFLAKMQKLSQILMQKQSQNLNLSEENFTLKQILNKNGLEYASY